MIYKTTDKQESNKEAPIYNSLVTACNIFTFYQTGNVLVPADKYRHALKKTEKNKQNKTYINI